MHFSHHVVAAKNVERKRNNNWEDDEMQFSSVKKCVYVRKKITLFVGKQTTKKKTQVKKSYEKIITSMYICLFYIFFSSVITIITIIIIKNSYRYTHVEVNYYY